MGRKHGKKQQQRGDTEPAAKDDDEEESLLAAAAAWASSESKPSSARSDARLPPPFPKHQHKVPDTGFLLDEDPYRESFQVALETCFEGVVWDKPSISEKKFQGALRILDDAAIFRTDITQPAGLGAKCAKTYVTRCLLGATGTTYKYLGLRMFSHPWEEPLTSNSTEVQKAINVIFQLNQQLTENTNQHMETLAEKRRKRNFPEPVIHNSSPASFDVTLLNKMTPARNLKKEPMFSTQKCSVSWHADSSLEHYSSIAVYHTVMDSQKKKPDDWSVALRVAHNAEGPFSKRLGEIAVQESDPPIAMSLPSGAAYYLLDDHNHHHQHAVLAPSSQNSTTTRFSSTHRLLRQGQHVRFMMERCETACHQFNKKTLKRFRSEQLLLNELETEWLRQFFVQGSHHKDLLWHSWEAPVTKLFQYWGMLEARTLQGVLLLKNAAEERCDLECNKKQREKRKKALASVQPELYTAMAQLLRDRSKMRQLWSEREQDVVFKPLAKDCKPIPFPVAYGGQNEKEALGHSPLSSGSPSFLNELASCIAAWGKCYESRDASKLPAELTPALDAAQDEGSKCDEVLAAEQDEEATAPKPKKKKRKKKKPTEDSQVDKTKKRRY
jgi:hypothetical protein